MHEARDLVAWGITFAQPTIDVAAVRDRTNKIIANSVAGLRQLAKQRKVQVAQRARARFLTRTTL